MSRLKHSIPFLAVTAAAAIAAPAGAAPTPVEPALHGVTATAVSSQPADALPLGALRGAGGVNDSAAVGGHDTSIASAGGGFDWGDATIGAAGALALLGVAGGVVFLTRRAGRQPAGAG
jgi:hypothetical protein